MSPVLFIMALDQLVQEFDKNVKGVKCGRILELKVLAYVDDAALIEHDVDDMTARLTALANASRDHADINVNMSKTYPQHVHRREAIKATEEEEKAAEAKYKNQCDFCQRKFATHRGMRIHRARCIQNYVTTEKTYELEEIRGAFGRHGTR